MTKGKATKSIRTQAKTCHRDWFISTTELYNEVTGFYLLLLLDNVQLLSLSQKEALSQLEKLTIVGKERPLPEMLLPWDVPMLFRRACINQAIGAASSFFSNLKKWEQRQTKKLALGKKFTERPPVPPRKWNWKPVFYTGMQKKYTGNTIMLKLWTGSSWAWVKAKLEGQQIPDGWKRKCPHAVVKDKRVELHFPIELEFERPLKAAVQALDPRLRVCAVDLNIGNNLAVCTILNSDGTQVATRFIEGGDNLTHRRKRLLGKVAIQRQKTGILKKGEADNITLWEKIRNIDDYEAHRISRRIVDFAITYKSSIIVFEHLGNFKPRKGKYSKRGNEKRSYWLRGKIFKFTQYKAWALQVLTCRVNPRNTSRDCGHCGLKVARHDEHELPNEYKPGAPRFTCPNGHKGNADLNAARNIAFRFFARHKLPTVLNIEKPTPETVGCSASASNRRVSDPGRGSGTPQVYPSYTTRTGAVQFLLFDLSEVESTTHKPRNATTQGCP